MRPLKPSSKFDIFLDCSFKKNFRYLGCKP